MTLTDHPRARQAERARKAAKRAREHRERVRQAMAIDAALVDALGAAFAQVKPNKAFLELMGTEAIRRLREAGVEKPNRTMRQRLGLLKAWEVDANP